ncbi:MAG: diacylglycerol/lipid kinase family protein [Christensenellales bacterium]|jgi:diacylglycerol kinase (ATP)
MLHLIVNPIAGKIKKTDAVRRVTEFLKQEGRKYCITFTEAAGHATKIAREAVGMGHDIMVLGGDGTLGEAAGGVIGTDRLFYVVPCGTGNDFVKSLRLPSDPIEALKKQLTGYLRKVDAGMMNDRCFLNVCGTGFDVDTLRYTERFKKRMTGILPYLLGVIYAFFGFRGREIQISMGGKSIKKPLTIVAVANGQYFGGGMRISPNADVRDGLFDVTYIDDMPKPKMCALLPTVIPGKFLRFACTHVERAKEVLLECAHMTVNVDGELIDTDRALIRVLSGALNMRLPV